MDTEMDIDFTHEFSELGIDLQLMTDKDNMGLFADQCYKAADKLRQTVRATPDIKAAVEESDRQIRHQPKSVKDTVKTYWREEFTDEHREGYESMALHQLIALKELMEQEANYLRVVYERRIKDSIMDNIPSQEERERAAVIYEKLQGAFSDWIGFTNHWHQVVYPKITKIDTDIQPTHHQYPEFQNEETDEWTQDFRKACKWSGSDPSLFRNAVEYTEAHHDNVRVVWNTI